jgi:hypothetical protein
LLHGVVHGCSAKDKQAHCHRRGTPEAALTVHVDCSAWLILEPACNISQLFDRWGAPVGNRNVTLQDTKFFKPLSVGFGILAKVDHMIDPSIAKTPIFFWRQGAPDVEPIVHAIDALGGRPHGRSLRVIGCLWLLWSPIRHVVEASVCVTTLYSLELSTSPLLIWSTHTGEKKLSMM